MHAELIDRIYESSFVPEQWPGVLDELAVLTEASGGLLFAVRDKVLNWTSSASLSAVFQSYVSDGWFSRCARRICLFSQNQPTFLVEHDFWTAEQLDANPIYRDFFRPHGLGWSAGTGLMMPTGDNIVFSIERQFERGPVERERIDALNALRPHLARAALIAARLSLRSASTASDALAAMGLPALVLDESGTVIETNALMQGLEDHVQWRALDRIALKDASADALLRAALAAPDNTAWPRRTGRPSDPDPARSARYLRSLLCGAGHHTCHRPTFAASRVAALAVRPDAVRSTCRAQSGRRRFARRHCQ